MGLENQISGASRRLLDFVGEDVTLTTQTVSGYDDYGDPQYTTEQIETTAQVVVRGTPAFDRRIEGIDTDVTAVAWINDEHRDSISTGADSDATGPMTLETDTHEFGVNNWFDEGNGKLRLHLNDA